MRNSLTHQIDSDIYQSDMARDKKEKDGQDKGGGVQVLIRLSNEINDLLEMDSRHHKRSKKGQVEAILEAYYELYEGDIRSMVEIRARLSPKHNKPASDSHADESTRKANSALVGLPTPLPTILSDVARYVTEKAGIKVDTTMVTLYRAYVKGKDQSFLELPENIQNVIIAFYEGNLESYLSRELTG